jgi:hypothetical protein
VHTSCQHSTSTSSSTHPKPVLLLLLLLRVPQCTLLLLLGVWDPLKPTPRGLGPSVVYNSMGTKPPLVQQQQPPQPPVAAAA